MFFTKSDTRHLDLHYISQLEALRKDALSVLTAAGIDTGSVSGCQIPELMDVYSPGGWLGFVTARLSVC